MENNKLLLQMNHNLNVFYNKSQTLYLSTNKNIHLTQKHPLIQLQIEISTHLTLYQHQSNQLRKSVHELLLLRTTVTLFNTYQIVLNTRLQHLIEGTLALQLHHHHLHLLQSRHLHVHPNHHLVEILLSVLRTFHYSTRILLLQYSTPKSIDRTFVH